MFDVVLLAAVNVNGLFVQEHQRTWKIHFADDRAGPVMSMITKLSLLTERRLIVSAG